VIFLVEIEAGVMKRISISIGAGLMQGFFLNRIRIDENKASLTVIRGWILMLQCVITIYVVLS